MKKLNYSQVLKLYWLAFLGMLIIRVISRTHPDLIVPYDAETVSHTQSIFSIIGTFTLVFCIWATYRIFREKGIGKVISAINGILSIFMWAIIMIAQMIYILAIRKMPENEVTFSNEHEDS